MDGEDEARVLGLLFELATEPGDVDVDRAGVYLARDSETLVLLFCGGTKKRQQADIATALTLHVEYDAR